MDERASEIPSPDEVRAQVVRMIASDDFIRSPQLGAFLRFVVDAVLQGKSERIKAYTIGVDVLRRDTSFDPQIDPIVRVEATRLRRTIDRYYAGIGNADVIRVDLPRGSYVPTFTRPTSPGSQPQAAVAPSRSTRIIAAAAVAVVAIVASVVVWNRFEPAPGLTARESQEGAQQRSGGGSLPAGNGLPILLMPTFQVSGAPGPRSISAHSLHDTLSAAFGRFDLVNVQLEPTERQASADGGTAMARALHADYRFAGSVDYAEDGTAHLLFRLIDVADDKLVWSRTFDRLPPGDDQSAAEEQVVRELAGTLLQPFGVIYAHQRAKVLNGAVTDPRYRCLTDVIESFATFDSDQQIRGYDCLTGLIHRDPSFALGFTYLAAVDLREYQYGIGLHGGELPPLDRGLASARRGVELNPELARAYEMLFVIQFARRELGAAFDAANKAIALNRNDMRLLGAYGARLIAGSDVDKGLAMLRQAGDDGTVRPPFEEFFLFLAAYLRNDMRDAAFHSSQITNDSFQLGLVAHALTADALGDHAAAGSALARLVSLNPAWRDDLRGSLARFFYAPAIIERLADRLSVAGLTKAP
jgi:TolB-like protein/tetratricopeptide (TPR) repeat protein